MQLKILCIVAVVVILWAVFWVLVAIYFMKKEQRLAFSIQRMLDDAIEGKPLDVKLKESRFSVIENDMWRYLCDNQMSYQKLTAEKEQIQSQISDISHQTVTPISNILLYTQLLEEWVGAEGNSPKEIGEWLSAIQNQTRELDFLIESLVKLSRLEGGMINVSGRKQGVQTLLSLIEKQFASKAAEKQILFLVGQTEETAVFDMNWTVEALANVVDNAIKYTPFGGRVSIQVEAYSFFIRIYVKDDGPGIAEEEQANVFTRFYRSPSVKEKQGLGLGLYLTREILAAQNGYMKLTSKLGEGSTFSLFLPKEEISQK